MTIQIPHPGRKRQSIDAAGRMIARQSYTEVVPFVAGDVGLVGEGIELVFVEGPALDHVRGAVCECLVEFVDQVVVFVQLAVEGGFAFVGAFAVYALSGGEGEEAEACEEEGESW